MVFNRSAFEVRFDGKLPFSPIEPRIHPERRLRRDRELVTRFVTEELEPVYPDGTRTVFRLSRRGGS